MHASITTDRTTTSVCGEEDDQDEQVAVGKNCQAMPYRRSNSNNQQYSTRQHPIVHTFCNL